jgi:hypothetical protein
MMLFDRSYAAQTGHAHFYIRYVVPIESFYEHRTVE